MTYHVVVSNKARQDVIRIFDWLEERSRPGAISWMDAFNRMTARLPIAPESNSIAEECQSIDRPLRQVFFQTRSGRKYRAIFIIENANIRILRVRAPGQRIFRRERDLGL